ncbi:MAG: YqaJ viral recombinase family protein [bacterium]
MSAPDITRQDWLDLRRSGIGSSDAAAACGESSTSPAELVLQKRGIMRPHNLSEIEAVQWGNLLEPVIMSLIKPVIIRNTASRKGLRILDPVLDRRMIEHEIEQTGETEVVGWIDRSQAFLRSVERPWQHAAIDGIAIDEHSGLVDIEAKNVGFYHSREWDPENGIAPAKFDIQIAHQLAVAPAFKTAILAGLVGGNSLRILIRERISMHATIEAVIALETRVWKCIGNGDLPPFNGSESHIRALRAMHPKDNGQTISLPVESIEWDEELRGLQSAQSHTVKRIKELQRMLESAMDGNTYGELPEGRGVYSNRWQDRKGHEVKPSSFPVLRRDGNGNA